MGIVKIKYINIKDLTEVQKKAVLKLQKECFSDVPKQSIEEDFIAQEFGKIFAYKDREIIGMLSLFKREIVFADKKIALGGMGGVCVTPTMQRKGAGTLMLKNGLSILKRRKCDIACLNVDLEKRIYDVYEKVGFKMMEREISFENVKGEIVKDSGAMFIPINSKDIYDLVMNGNETFHYGRGYW